MGTLGGNICLDTRCLWYNQSLTWRKGCGFCIKKDGNLCHVAPGGTKCWAAFSADTPPALLCLNGGNRDCRPEWFAARSLARVLHRRRRTLSQAAAERTGHARVSARGVGGLSRRLPQAAGSRIDRLSFGGGRGRDEAFKRTRVRCTHRDDGGESRAQSSCSGLGKC